MDVGRSIGVAAALVAVVALAGCRDESGTGPAQGSAAPPTIVVAAGGSVAADAPAAHALAPATTPGANANASGAMADAPQAANLTGEFAARGVDDDGDGLFETLAVDAGVEVREEGRFQVWMRIADAAGNQLATGQAEEDLTAGTHTITVSIDGVEIRRWDADGPYTVTAVDLFVLNEAGATAHRQELLDVLVTEAYASRSFAAPQLEIDGPLRDEARDRDGDGKADAVVVWVGVTAGEAGTYGLSAALDSAQFRYLAFSETEPLILEAGSHELELVFDSLPLRSHGADGPYSIARLVADRLTDGAAVPMDGWHGTYETAAYRASEFSPMASQ